MAEANRSDLGEMAGVMPASLRTCSISEPLNCVKIGVWKVMGISSPVVGEGSLNLPSKYCVLRPSSTTSWSGDSGVTTSLPCFTNWMKRGYWICWI